jgi:hypothetical protein
MAAKEHLKSLTRNNIYQLEITLASLETTLCKILRKLQINLKNTQLRKEPEVKVLLEKVVRRQTQKAHLKTK